MITERQADVLIAGRDILVSQVARNLVDGDTEKAERIIGVVADWLTFYRPQEFGDDYCSPLEVAAYILRKGEYSPDR